MAITSNLAPTQRQQQQVAKQISNLQKQGWGDYGFENDSNISTSQNATNDAWNQYYNNLSTPSKAEDFTIQTDQPRFEIPLTVQVPTTQATDLIQRELEYEQKEIDYDQGQILEAIQTLKQESAFSAFGSLAINSEWSTNTEPAEPLDKPESPKENNWVNPEEVTKSSQLETIVEDKHTQNPQEFKDNSVNLVRHHSDIDFPYFFGWLKGLLEPKAENALQFLGKIFGTIFKTGKKFYKGFKVNIWDELIWKQTLGLGKKKELTKEEKEKKAKEVSNKRIFFEQLKTGLARILSSERRLAMRSRLEKLNRALKRGNLSYEGDLNEAGQIRESTLLEEELANSKLNEQQLLAERRKKLMMSKPSVKKGPGITMSADKAHNFNNAAKLAG